MTDFEAQVYATIIGGGIAAAVSFILAWQSNRAVSKRDKEERRQNHKSALLKLQMRASILASDVTNTMRTIDDMMRAANRAGRTGWPKHARITSIVGSYDKISFPVDELEPLVEAKEFELVNDLIEISMRHQAFMEAISTYSRMRLELKNKVTIASTDGNVLGAMLDDHELRQLQPYLIELETLISQALEMGRDLEAQTKRTVTKVGPAARKFLADPHFPKIQYDTPTA